MITVVGCGRFPLNFAPQKETDEIDQKQLVGTWVAWHSTKTEVLDLHADGTYRFVLVGDSTADFSGKWAVNGRDLELNVDKFVDGNRERIGDKVRWKIEKVEANEIVLGGLNEDTTYIRQQTKK